MVLQIVTELSIIEHVSRDIALVSVEEETGVASEDCVANDICYSLHLIPLCWRFTFQDVFVIRAGITVGDLCAEIFQSFSRKKCCQESIEFRLVARAGFDWGCDERRLAVNRDFICYMRHDDRAQAGCVPTWHRSLAINIPGTPFRDFTCWKGNSWELSDRFSVRRWAHREQSITGCDLLEVLLIRFRECLRSDPL